MTSLEELLEKIKIIEHSHPRIYNMWTTYLQDKIDKNKNIIAQCDKMLEYVQTIKEPSEDLLLSLTILNIL